MDFISNQKLQVEEMLKTIGVSTIDELFCDIPKHLRQLVPAQDDGLSEYEGMTLMQEIAAKNTFPNFTNYLGGGAYEHHVPAVVGAICGKSEFLTSYTPYQAEASQGMLQAIFEFQSAVCALTGMDVANASLYDGATACAEAVLMALRCNNSRSKVIICQSVHPHYRAVVEQYVSSHHVQIEWIPFMEDGSFDQKSAASLIDDQTAAVLIQYPNFFGVIENVAWIAAKAKASGALTIVSANPLVFGLFASGQELGADIVVGDTQPLGLPLQFGGPYVGYIACKQAYIRQLPGRIVGETVDGTGKRGFVLTLQAREQHIRREKATSNICTNQALAALASLVAMLWYGPVGIKKLALTNYQRANYLKQQLALLPGIKINESTPGFNEFIISFGRPLAEVYEHFRNYHIEPGIDLECFYPELKDSLLVAVTETKNLAQLSAYLECAKQLCLQKTLG